MYKPKKIFKKEKSDKSQKSQKKQPQRKPRQVYRPKQSLVINEPTQGSLVRLNNSKRTRIAHRELVDTVGGSVAFYCDEFGVNLGRKSVFPWGSKVAIAFEQYQLSKLSFIYKPTVSPLGATGKVYLAMLFDAAEEKPQDEKSLANVEDNKCAFTATEFRLDVNLSRFKTPKYVRQGDVPVNADPRMYDIGTLLVGLVGQPDDSAIGTLYVEYEAELIKTTNNHEESLDNLQFHADAPDTILDLQQLSNVTVQGNNQWFKKVIAMIDGVNHWIWIFDLAGEWLVNTMMWWDTVTTPRTDGFARYDMEVKDGFPRSSKGNVITARDLNGKNVRLGPSGVGVLNDISSTYNTTYKKSINIQSVRVVQPPLYMVSRLTLQGGNAYFETDTFITCTYLITTGTETLSVYQPNLTVKKPKSKEEKIKEKD